MTGSKLIALAGLQGTGKSTLALALAEAFRARGTPHALFHVDAIRKELAGYPQDHKLPEEFYTLEYTLKTYKEFEERIEKALKVGKTVIADATFTAPAAQTSIRAVAERADAKFVPLWLEVPLELALQRIGVRNTQGVTMSDVSVERVAFVAQFVKWPEDWFLLDATKPVAELCTEALMLSDKIPARTRAPCDAVSDSALPVAP